MNFALLNWITQQASWLRIAADRLIQNGSLSEADIADFVAIIKDPARILPQTPPEPAETPPVTQLAQLRLLALGPIEGIDALNPRTPLGFGAGNLSVVYGHNGAGKTGYTRIIANACGKASASALSGNVFTPAARRQLCKIKYSIGGIEAEVEWTPPSPVEELATIDIFDSNSGRIYLENETEATFMPPELALLADLVKACGRVQSKLETEELGLVNRLPVIRPEHVGTAAAINYGLLRHDWTDPQIATVIEWTEQQASELEQLNKNLSIADPTAAAQQRRRVKQQRESLANTLENALSQLTGEKLDATRGHFRAATEKRRAAIEAAEVLRSSSSIDGVGGATWRAMWTAASEFAVKEAHPGTPFPFIGTGARCVFCQQELDSAARQRLTTFESFVSGRIETDAKNAETALKEYLKTITKRPTVEALQTAAQAAELNQLESGMLETAWAELEISLRPLREGNCPDFEVQPCIHLSEFILTLRRLAAEAENAAITLMDSANPESRQASDKRRKELLAQKWVTEQASAIRIEIGRLKQVHAYRAWKRQAGTTGLSRKANDLSEELVTDAYIQRFNSELRQLGASGINVKLERTGATLGRVKHSVSLSNTVVEGAGITAILSEGERRIISLAAFLADVTGRATASPFIFDDPISSLDQTWEERTIDRLIALSETRQVIVFTHRLSMLGIISDKAANLHSIHIRREAWGTGQPSDVPIYGKSPDGVLRKLKNERLARARRALNDEGHDAYYPLCKAICGDLRVVTERLVELILLSGVVQRHSREIKTRNIIRQLSKIRSGDCSLIEEFMDKYSRYEHSQSAESPVELPNPNELNADIDRLLIWHDEFKARPAP